MAEGDVVGETESSLMAAARLRRPQALVAILPLLIPLLGAPARATPGALDSSFGGDGKVKTEFASGAALASTVLVRPDGKIVAAGGAGDLRFAVAQYGPDGTLDMSLGADGKAAARSRLPLVSVRPTAALRNWTVTGKSSSVGGPVASASSRSRDTTRMGASTSRCEGTAR